MMLLRWLLLPAFIILTGCGDPSVSPSNTRHLRLNIATEPPTLNPLLASDTTSGAVLRFLFDGLTRFDPSGKVVPSVAEKIDISDDGTQYTFHLRESYWSNGDPVTADHFVYTLRKALSPDFPSQTAYKLFVIKNGKKAKARKVPVAEIGVHALDSKTLVIDLEHPAPYFLDITATHYLFPIHPDTDIASPKWANDSGPNYISNGPFLLGSWRHHNEIVATKSPSYWDSEVVRLDRVTISMVGDANTELQMFEEGEIDWAGQPLSISLPTDAIPSLKEQGLLHIENLDASYFFLFNTNHPVLQNKKIRQALSYSIDRAGIVTNITIAGEVATTSIVPLQLSVREGPFYGEAEKARALQLFDEGLLELGLSREAIPPLTLSYNTSLHHHRIAQYLQQQWSEALGITILLENTEWKVYLGKIASCDFSIARLAYHADFRDPSTFLNLFRYTDTGVNCSGWQDENLLSVMERADQTLDKEKRAQLLLRAEEILADEMPLAPVYALTEVYVKNPRLKNISLANPGVIDFKWAFFD